MANLLSSFLNGSSTFTYNNGTNVIPSYTLVQPTFSNTSTGASIFNQTFGSSSSFGNSLLFGSSLGGSTLTGSFGNSFNVGGFNTSFNYGSLGNGFGFGTIARTSTTPTTTTTPSGRRLRRSRLLNLMQRMIQFCRLLPLISPTRMAMPSIVCRFLFFQNTALWS